METKGAAFLCSCIGFLVYLNSLGLQFCFDDEIAINKNHDIMSNSSWSNLLFNDFWGKPISSSDSHKSYRPLTVATFRLNYLLHELQPLGYHLVNVLLHSAVCYLYVLLCGVVFSEVWPALIAGLLFAVHPIHTEAVSGVVGRADVLSALFFILAVFSYRAALTSSTKSQKCGRVVLSLLLVLCSALSKEIGITAVAICLFYELLIHRKLNVGDIFAAVRSGQMPVWCVRLIASALIFGIFAIAFLALRLVLNQGPPRLTFVEVNPAVDFPTPLRQLHWSYLCVLNVWLLLSPSQLCAEYAMGTIPPIASLTDPRNLLTLATFASLLSVGCYAMSTRDAHHRKLLFGLCLMIIPFIPASNLFFPVGFVIAERVLYIPSMGFSMIVAYGAWLLISHKTLRQTAKSIIAILLVLHTAQTLNRNQDWSNNLTLFSSALRVGSKDLIVLNNLAVTLQEGDNLDLAEAVLRHSMEVDPSYISTHMRLAQSLKDQQRYQESIEIYEMAEKLVTQSFSNDSHIMRPDGSTRVYMQLASLLLTHTERYHEAYRLTRKAVRVEEDWEQTHNLMGKCLVKLERYSEAVVAFKKALELKEDFAGAHTSLGETLLELGELDEAEGHFRRAMALDSEDTVNRLRLVKVILDHTMAQTTERLTEAVNIALKIHDLEPDNGNVTLSLAMLHEKLGDGTRALAYMEEVVADNPNMIYLHMALSQLYYKAKKYAKSKAELHWVLDQTSNDTRALLQLGTIHLEMKEYPEARTYLQAAVEASPNEEAALVNYGLSLIHTRDNHRAKEVFQKLVSNFPNNPSYAQQVSFLEKQLKKTVDSPSEHDTTK